MQVNGHPPPSPAPSASAGSAGPLAPVQGGCARAGLVRLERKVEAANRPPLRETALQPSCCGGYVFIPCTAGKLGSKKEDDGERAGALPLGEHVPGFSGR